MLAEVLEALRVAAVALLAAFGLVTVLIAIAFFAFPSLDQQVARGWGHGSNVRRR